MTRDNSGWGLLEVGLCVMLLILAGSIATAAQPGPMNPEQASAATTQLSEAPTENVTRQLRLSVSRGSDKATVSVVIAYPARSDTEATLAANGTLNRSWFDGRHLVHRIHNQTADSTETLTTTDESLRYEEISWAGGRGDPQAEHGWVILRYEAVWESFVSPDDDIVVDETYGDVLENSSSGSEWALRVEVPQSWEPTTVGGGVVVEPTGQTATRYRWNDIRTVSGPFLILESPLATPTSEDGAVGPTGGVLVTIVVFVLVARYGS